MAAIHLAADAQYFGYGPGFYEAEDYFDDYDPRPVPVATYIIAREARGGKKGGKKGGGGGGKYSFKKLHFDSTFAFKCKKKRIDYHKYFIVTGWGGWGWQPEYIYLHAPHIPHSHPPVIHTHGETYHHYHKHKGWGMLRNRESYHPFDIRLDYKMYDLFCYFLGHGGGGGGGGGHGGWGGWGHGGGHGGGHGHGSYGHYGQGIEYILEPNDCTLLC